MSFFDPAPPVTYRPLSVSIIGWYHAVTGFLGLMFAWIPFTMPTAVDSWSALGVDPSRMMAVGLASNIVYAAAGTAILKRLDWGRILLLVALPSVMVASAYFNPGFRTAALVSGVVTLAILAYFLTRPAANDYFSGAVLEAPDEIRLLRQVQRAEGSGSDLKRIFGVLTAVPGWWIMTLPLTFLAFAFHRAVIGERALSLWGVPMVTGLISIGLLWLGAWLWGSRRWRAYIGWGLAAFGFMAAWMGILVSFPMELEQFLPPEALENFDPEEFAVAMRLGGRYALAMAVPLLGGGTFLLSAQRRHDRAAAAELADLADL